MAKQRPPWFVPRDAASVRYAFFLSHVAEDSEEVQQLASTIHAFSGRGGRTPLTCFLDVNNWPIGCENTSVIKAFLLKSAYCVVWVTPAYLQSVRGWVWMELAYAELIELSLNAALLDLRHPYIVPVFRNVTVNQLERTPLFDYWQRQLVVPNKEYPLHELAKKLVEFHEQEGLH
ncbi:MAG TPA: toll/interleukin-1 receptor domain-containing protein [Gemmataceae bacterium]|nr:toll/interleukin-1 receptor domain-containing protein [Gemmataceae bacterium]